MVLRCTIALCGILLLATTTKARGEPSLAEVRKAVVDAHNAIDQISISCFVHMRYVGNDEQSSMGSIEYRFDRKTNRLAIGTDGVPILLVQGNKLLLRMQYGEEDDGIYLVVNSQKPITWRDVDEACKSIRDSCPLVDDTSLRTYCFMLPLLGDGEQRLFGPASAVLTENDKDHRWLFAWGHPDLEVRIGIGGGEQQQQLAPQRVPWCISMDGPQSHWQCAFDRHTGMMTAARGVLSLPRPRGIPDAKVEVLLKRWFSFADGAFAEAREVSFEPPPNAKFVAAAGLRATYLQALRSGGRQDLLLRKQRYEEHAQSQDRLRSELAASIAKRRSTAGADEQQLKEDEEKMKQLDGNRVLYEIVLTDIQEALDGFGDKP